MDDAELRDLQERTALIEEMANHPGWAMLVDRAHATIGMKQQRVLNGRLKDFEEYRREVDYMDGMFFVLRIPEQVKQELDDEMRERGEWLAAQEADEAA